MESHFPFKISIHKDSYPTKYATSNWYNSATSYTKSVPLHMNAPSTDFPFLNASFDQHLNFHKGNDAHEYPHTIIYVSQVQPHITPISTHNQQQSTHIEFLPPASNLPHMDMDNPANTTTEMDSHLPRINDASSIETLQVSTSLPSHLPSSNQDSKIITRSKNNISSQKKIFNLSTRITPIEPHTFNQALQSTHWRQAMSDEYDALLHNSTWSLVTPHATQNVIGCKGIFQIERNLDGSIARYKARLVAKGFHQHPDIDFIDTFSPIVKLTTIQVILSIAVMHGWQLRQLDVNNAFLQGTLSDDVFMQQSPRFSISNIHIMCASSKRPFMAFVKCPKHGTWNSKPFFSHLVSPTTNPIIHFSSYMVMEGPLIHLYKWMISSSLALPHLM